MLYERLEYVDLTETAVLEVLVSSAISSWRVKRAFISQLPSHSHPEDPFGKNDVVLTMHLVASSLVRRWGRVLVWAALKLKGACSSAKFEFNL